MFSLLLTSKSSNLISDHHKKFSFKDWWIKLTPEQVTFIQVQALQQVKFQSRTCQLSKYLCIFHHWCPALVIKCLLLLNPSLYFYREWAATMLDPPRFLFFLKACPPITIGYALNKSQLWSKWMPVVMFLHLVIPVIPPIWSFSTLFQDYSNYLSI